MLVSVDKSNPAVFECKRFSRSRDVSPEYRWSTYFVTATLHLYRGSIAPNEATLFERGFAEHDFSRVDWFVENNPDLMKRIRQESRNLFGYDLSHRQLCVGVYAYFCAAQKVDGTEPAKLS